MNRNKKILNVTMAAGMAAVLGTTPVIAAAQEADNGVSKEETVYVNATAEGEIKDITVSDWLKIPDQQREIYPMYLTWKESRM